MANSTNLNVSSHPICVISIATFDPYNPIRPDAVNPTWTFLAIFNGLTAFPTAGVNALIIWTVFSDEDLRSCPFNLLLGELAVTDMLVGLVSQPLFVSVLACFINFCYSPCQFTVYVMSAITSTGTTMVTMALACTERYLSIEQPNLYNRIVTKERVQKVAVISWISTLVYLVAFTTFLNKTYPSLTRVPITVLFVVCATIILFCCAKVQLTAYHQKRAIAIQQHAVNDAQAEHAANDAQAEHEANDAQAEHEANDAQANEEQARHRQKLKQVLTTTFLTIVTVIFMTPFIFASSMQVATDQDIMFRYLAGPICVTLANLQSLINPAILALRLSYIRNGIKNKLTFLISLFRFGNIQT